MIMTTITMNSRKINDDSFSTRTVADIIDHLYTETVAENEVITDCLLDGETYEVGHPHKIFDYKSSEFKKIEFVTKTNLELGIEALESCPAYIDNMCEKIQHLISAYQTQGTGTNELFGDIVDTLDLYIQLMSQIFQILKSNRGDNFKKGDEIQKLEIHLLSVLKAMLPAKEKEDIIMLTDLLEYELIDNLTQWKIKIVPELRREFNSATSKRRPEASNA